jgi:hypothetical protein
MNKQTRPGYRRLQFDVPEDVRVTLAVEAARQHLSIGLFLRKILTEQAEIIRKKEDVTTAPGG